MARHDRYEGLAPTETPTKRSVMDCLLNGRPPLSVLLFTTSHQRKDSRWQSPWTSTPTLRASTIRGRAQPTTTPSPVFSAAISPAFRSKASTFFLAAPFALTRKPCKPKSSQTVVAATVSNTEVSRGAPSHRLRPDQARLPRRAVRTAPRKRTPAHVSHGRHRRRHLCDRSWLWTLCLSVSNSCRWQSGADECTDPPPLP